MATKIPVPRLGQSEETVTIQSWKVKEGDVIKKGDVLFDVETDKAVLDSFLQKLIRYFQRCIMSRHQCLNPRRVHIKTYRFILC